MVWSIFVWLGLVEVWFVMIESCLVLSPRSRSFPFKLTRLIKRVGAADGRGADRPAPSLVLLLMFVNRATE